MPLSVLALVLAAFGLTGPPATRPASPHRPRGRRSSASRSPIWWNVLPVDIKAERSDQLHETCAVLESPMRVGVSVALTDDKRRLKPTKYHPEGVARGSSPGGASSDMCAGPRSVGSQRQAQMNAPRDAFQATVRLPSRESVQPAGPGSDGGLVTSEEYPREELGSVERRQPRPGFAHASPSFMKGGPSRLLRFGRRTIVRGKGHGVRPKRRCCW